MFLHDSSQNNEACRGQLLGLGPGWGINLTDGAAWASSSAYGGQEESWLIEHARTHTHTNHTVFCCGSQKEGGSRFACSVTFY